MTNARAVLNWRLILALTANSLAWALIGRAIIGVLT